MKEEKIEAEDFKSTEADKIRLALNTTVFQTRVEDPDPPGHFHWRREKEKNIKITTEKLQGNW